MKTESAGFRESGFLTGNRESGNREFRRFRSPSAASDVVATLNKMAMAARASTAQLCPVRALAVGGGQDAAELLAGLGHVRQSGSKEKGSARNSDPFATPSRNLEVQTFST